MSDKNIQNNTFNVKPSLLGKCLNLAGGNKAAGILLFRITSRSNMKSTMEDKKGESGWAVLTREQWSIDTGLTPTQYDRALAFLKKQKLIKYKHLKIGRYKGGSGAIWLKPNDKPTLYSTFCKTANPKGSFTLQNCKPIALSLCKFANPYINKSNIKGNKFKKEASVNAKTDSNLEEDSNLYSFSKEKEKRKKARVNKNLTIEKENSMKKERTGKMAERDKEKRGFSFDQTEDRVMSPKKTRKEITGVMSMEYVWKELLAEYYGDDYFSGWTQKELGMAKGLLSKTRDAKRPIVEMLEAAFDYWDGLREFIADEAGLTKTPNQPNVGFLSVHRDLFYRFYIENKDGSVVQPSAKDVGETKPNYWKPNKEES